MIPAMSLPAAPINVRGGPGVRVERNGTSTIVSLSDVVLLTSGTGPDFTVDSPDGTIRLFDGLSLLLRMDRTGPNAPTLSVDGSPRAPWLDANGSPIADGVLQLGSLQRAVYDAERGIWLNIQLGGPGSSGVSPDFTGPPFARVAYDDQPQGKTFLAVDDTPPGPTWTLYVKRSNALGDWSSGLAIKASPAQTTVEAQAAAERAAAQVPLAAQAGAEQVARAQAQALAAAARAAVAEQQAALSVDRAGVATAQAAAAAMSAVEARDVVNLIGVQIFDFSFDSEAIPTDDWSN